MKRFLLLLSLLCLSALPALGFLNPAAIQPGGTDPAGDLNGGGGRTDPFPNHDPRFELINLTGNTYNPGDGFPHGYYMKYPCFNADGTRIALAARNTNVPPTTPNEIWIMDYDAGTRAISNFQQITTTGGTGDIAENIMPSWSRSDPDLLLFAEIHMTSANLVKTYDVGTATFQLLYDPALDTNGQDVTNPGFLGTSSTTIVTGSAYGSGNDRILVFDGTYPSTTISSADQNLDPSSNLAGDRVTYYSTNATCAASIYSQNLPPWTQNNNGFGNCKPGYWSFYSGKAGDKMLALRDGLGWSATGFGLYDSGANLLSDLLGNGGTDFKWVYANFDWEGPKAEILFRGEHYTHAGYGNNLYLAIPPVINQTSGLGYVTIQAAITAASPGDVITVAAGTYAERIRSPSRWPSWSPVRHRSHAGRRARQSGSGVDHRYHRAGGGESERGRRGPGGRHPGDPGRIHHSGQPDLPLCG